MANYTKKEFRESMESMNPYFKGVESKTPTATGMMSDHERYLREVMADRLIEYLHKLFDYTIDDRRELMGFTARGLSVNLQWPKWPNFYGAQSPGYVYTSSTGYGYNSFYELYKSEKEKRKENMDKIDKIISKLIEKKILPEDLTIVKYLELKKELFDIIDED